MLENSKQKIFKTKIPILSMSTTIFKKNKAYSFIAILLILIIVSFKIILPFANAIFMAIILAFIFYPIFKKVNKKVRNRTLSSSIMLVIITLIILIPTIFVGNILLKETLNVYSSVIEIDRTVISKNLNSLTGNTIDTSNYVYEGLDEFSKVITDNVLDFLLSIPRKIFELLIILFILFYLFKDNKKIVQGFKEIIPVGKRHKEELLKEFKVVTKAVIFGLIITGLAQGVIGSIGFLIFGIPNPILWGVAMTILSILPLVGPSLVWFPASLYLIFTGSVITGSLLLAYGILVISPIDTLLKPKLISSKTKIHPIIILLGLVGGIKMFGLVGIVVGPLILAFSLIFLKFYKEKTVLTR